MSTFGFFGIFGFAAFVLWVWALVDCIRVPDDSMFKSGNKLIWVIVIVFAPWVGAIIYLFVGRPAGGPNAVRPTGPPPPPPPPPPA